MKEPKNKELRNGTVSDNSKVITILNHKRKPSNLISNLIKNNTVVKSDEKKINYSKYGKYLKTTYKLLSEHSVIAVEVH